MPSVPRKCVYSQHFSPDNHVHSCIRDLDEMECEPSPNINKEEGANLMNLALTKRHLLLLVFLIVSLLIMGLFVIHSAVPGLWHSVSVTPNVPIWWH